VRPDRFRPSLQHHADDLLERYRSAIEWRDSIRWRGDRAGPFRCLLELEGLLPGVPHHGLSVPVRAPGCALECSRHARGYDHLLRRQPFLVERETRLEVRRGISPPGERAEQLRIRAWIRLLV